MILTFSTGEQRVFDESYLLDYPAFAPFKGEEGFKSAKVEYGVGVWRDGESDIAPETCIKKAINMKLP